MRACARSRIFRICEVSDKRDPDERGSTVPIITIALIIMPFIDRINVRYKLLGTYI